MTTASASAVVLPAPRARHGDFSELTKLRLNFLVLTTTLIGFIASSNKSVGVDWMLLIETLLGTGMCAAGASILNQVWEHRHDAKMTRTANRPIPGGRISAKDAAILGIITNIAGVAILALTVNLISSALALSTILLYVLVYTPLKRITTLNTLVGAIPGAIPPVIGYVATGHALDLYAFGLFALLFCWQMPHFMAIAILCRDDYAAAGFKMLPVVDLNLKRTAVQIVLWCVLLLAASLIPTYAGHRGWLYTSLAIVLGVGFLYTGVRCAIRRTRADARILFFASIIYLPVVLAVLAIDQIL